MGGSVTLCHCRYPTRRTVYSQVPWLYQSLLVVLVPSVKYLLQLFPVQCLHVSHYSPFFIPFWWYGIPSWFCFVVDIGLKSRWGQGCVPFWRLWGWVCFLALEPTHVPWSMIHLHPQSQQWLVECFSEGVPLILTLSHPRTLIIILAYSQSPGEGPTQGQQIRNPSLSPTFAKQPAWSQA